MSKPCTFAKQMRAFNRNRLHSSFVTRFIGKLLVISSSLNLHISREGMQRGVLISCIWDTTPVQGDYAWQIQKKRRKQKGCGQGPEQPGRNQDS